MIVDADPIVSACLGRSKPLFQQLLAKGIDLHVPEHQMREARLVTLREASRLKRDPAEAFGWVEAAISVVPATTYMIYEGEARTRLQSAGRKDWPLIALALASGDDIWSNDVDLFGTGLAVWNTYNILRSAASVDAGNNRN